MAEGTGSAMSQTDSAGRPLAADGPAADRGGGEGAPGRHRPRRRRGDDRAGEDWLAPAERTAARLVVAAWVTAVNGDDSALRALAEPAPPGPEGGGDRSAGDDHGAAHGLLHPAHKDWVIAPDPEVTGIALRRLDRSRRFPSWASSGGSPRASGTAAR